jgi:DNA invertase Pin-like site-specific DNA recombinase
MIVSPETLTREAPVTTDAFPYRRYSSGKQGRGNSLARQAEPFEALCSRMSWSPNYTLDLDDKGRSAYHGHHVSKGRLGFFLAAAKNGDIRPGSVLVIENQDRLSRQEVDPARELVRELLLANVNIYDQDDNVLITKESLNDPLSLIRLILRMERAHKESKRKAQFSSDNWSRKRKAIGEKKMTKTVPYWLQLRPDRTSFVVNEERAEMVREIFRWCVDGVGIATIAARLNDAGRKTGQQCKQVGSSSVQKILRNRAVLGEFTPISGRGKERKPSGETVKDYYPRIVDDGLWAQAQLALNGRGFAQGRKSKKINNLFERIAYNARDGYKLTFRDALPPRRPTSRLLSVGAIAGWPGSDYGSLNYTVVEAAILSHLSELDAASIFPDQSSADRLKLSAMKEELEQIDADLKQLNEEMAQPGMAATLLPAVRRLVGRKNKLAEEFQALNAKCVSPDADQLHTVQELLREAGGFNPADETIRLRLRSAIQRIVSSIWLLVVPRGHDRVIATQIDFKGGARRSYLILHRPTKSNGKATVTGFWQVRSWTDEEMRQACMSQQFDLRSATDPTWIGVDNEGHFMGLGGWKATESLLACFSAEDIDQLLFFDCPRHELP